MKTRIPQLDAVRGLAVLLVIMLHASDKYPKLHLEPLFRNGWMGVDLFFVLSGLLITGILVEAKESKNYFKNFYARRCLRIWPLYYSVLLFLFVVIPVIRASEAAVIFDKRSSPWWAYPLFLQNFLVPIPTMATGPLGVAWSLAIEEQFYLIWPWLVRFCSLEQLRRIALVVICASPFLRLYLSVHHVDIYSNFFCRLDGLMAGALLALLLRSPVFRPARLTNLAWLCLLIALPAALITDRYGVRWLVLSLTALSALSFIFVALFSESRLLRVILTNRFLTYTGSISYGLYLLHKIPFDVEQSLHLDRHPQIALVLGLLGSYALAALSWKYLETPFLRLKRFFREREAAEPGTLVGSSGLRAES